MRAWLLALGVALAPTLASTPPVRAQSGDVSKRALALGYEADTLYAKSRWADAYERFAEADRLAHSPVFVLYMARCRKNAGRLLEARSIYERVAAERIPADAPQPFRQAVADAAAEDEELAARIPSIVVVATGAPASGVAVRVDGRVVSPGANVPLDPGSHEVTAAAGDRSAKKTVVLAEGPSPVRVELSLAAPGQTPEQEGSLAPTVVALSFGVIGLGVGSVTGLLAASRTSDIEEGCRTDGHCPVSSQGDIDSANALATTSTIGFVVGGVGLAAALVLFLVRPGGASSKPPIAPSARGRMLLSTAF